MSLQFQKYTSVQAAKQPTSIEENNILMSLLDDVITKHYSTISIKSFTFIPNLRVNKIKQSAINYKKTFNYLNKN